MPSLKLVTNASAPVPAVAVLVGEPPPEPEASLNPSSPELPQDNVLSVAAITTTAGIRRTRFPKVFRQDEDNRMPCSVAIRASSPPVRSEYYSVLIITNNTPLRIEGFSVHPLTNF